MGWVDGWVNGSVGWWTGGFEERRGVAGHDKQKTPPAPFVDSIAPHIADHVRSLKGKPTSEAEVVPRLGVERVRI